MTNHIDIQFIFNFLASQTNSRLYSLILDEQQIKKLNHIGYIDDLPETQIMSIETEIPIFVKTCLSEIGYKFSDRVINAWTDLFSILIAPYNSHIRNECIKCLSPYEVSFINLYSFFSYWSQIQYKLLSNNDNAAKAMVRNKLDMFDLNPSKPIPKSMRNAIGMFTISQAKKHEKKKVKNPYYTAESKIFLLQPTLSGDFFENPLSPMLAEVMLRIHLKPTINYKLKSAQSNSIANESASVPLLVLLNKHKKGDYINSLDSINLKDFPITACDYRLSCLISLSSILSLVSKPKQDPVEGNVETFPWMAYLGFMDEVSVLVFYGFLLEINKDAQSGNDYLQYEHLSIAESKKLEEVFYGMALNVYQFFTTDKSESLFAMPDIALEDAYTFMRIDIGKIARLLGIETNIDHVIEKLKAKDANLSGAVNV